MGAEVCRKVQEDNINEVSTHDKARTCFNLCNNDKNQIKLKDKADIRPIEFSDADQQHDAGEKNSQMNGKSTALNLVGDDEKSAMKDKKQIAGQCPQSVQQGNLSRNEAAETSRSQPIVAQKSKEGKLQYLNSTQNYEPIPVPYSVIRLMIQPEILKQIKKYERDFHLEHGHQKAQTFRTWKLLKSGAYVNRISDGTTIVVKEKEFYRGKAILNTYIPEGQGSLITLLGAYHGHFKDGKAHGQGVLNTIDGKKKYEGTWRGGQLEKGKIVTEDYKYEGQLSRCQPNGRGVLTFVKSKTQYIGSFKNGLFQDAEATYTCQNYTYKGGFVRGKKDGFGILAPIKKASGGQLRNLPKLTGNFQQDVFKKSQFKSKNF